LLPPLALLLELPFSLTPKTFSVKSGPNQTIALAQAHLALTCSSQCLSLLCGPSPAVGLQSRSSCCLLTFTASELGPSRGKAAPSPLTEPAPAPSSDTPCSSPCAWAEPALAGAPCLGGSCRRRAHLRAAAAFRDRRTWSLAFAAPRCSIWLCWCVAVRRSMQLPVALAAPLVDLTARFVDLVCAPG
jgi:hypothetical protein